MTDPVMPPVVPTWISVATASIGIWFAKLIMGRHLKALDRVVHLSERTLDKVVDIDRRVSKIEGRIEQVDSKNGRRKSTR